MNDADRIKGMDEILTKVKQLKQRLAGQTLAAAAEEGLRPVFYRALQLAPYVTGRLRNSLRLKISKRGATKGEAYIGHEKFGSHAHLIEFGTKPHKIGKKGQHPGTQPQPFMRPAWDEKSDEARDTVEESLRHALEEAVK